MYSIDKLDISIKNKKGNSCIAYTKLKNIKQYYVKKIKHIHSLLIFFRFWFLNNYNSFLQHNLFTIILF